MTILKSDYIMKLDEIKRQTVPILRKYGVLRAAIFGSFARGEAGEESDLDILWSCRAQRACWI